MGGYAEMGKKIKNVGIIIGIVIILCIMITTLMPLFIKTSSYIAEDNATGNYWGYRAVGKAAPLWIYAFPVVIGGGLVWLELRSPLK
jgi:hypothetical protein